MLTLSHVSKAFAQTTVVDDISLKVKEGEIIGLLGPNGAGKTTTLRMITGVLPPTHGTITLDSLHMNTNYQKIKKRIGYLPENNPLYDEMTVEEHLLFWAKLKEIPSDSVAAAIDFVVENTGIKEVFYRPIAELSKGYRQRVGLSQAILGKPDILILDEPTEGLDPNQRQDIAALIRSLGKKRTVIVSSHVLSEIAKLCTRIVIIHQGNIVADDTPDRLTKHKGNVEHVEAEIKGDKVITNLQTLSGVSNVRKLHADYFLIEGKADGKLREMIFRTAVRQKWTLLTLVQKQENLEDIFAQLTKREKSS